MIDYPLRAFVEKTATWMNENLLIICQSFKALGGILFGGMVEKSSADGLPYLVVLFHVMRAARNDWQLESIQNLQQLFPHILSSF